MTIFDDNLWWQFLMTIFMTIFYYNLIGYFSTCDLWYLRHWLQYRHLRTFFHDNCCYLTINCDTGEHSHCNVLNMLRPPLPPPSTEKYILLHTNDKMWRCFQCHRLRYLGSNWLSSGWAALGHRAPYAIALVRCIYAYLEIKPTINVWANWKHRARSRLALLRPAVLVDLRRQWKLCMGRGGRHTHTFQQELRKNPGSRKKESRTKQESKSPVLGYLGGCRKEMKTWDGATVGRHIHTFQPELGKSRKEGFFSSD